MSRVGFAGEQCRISKMKTRRVYLVKKIMVIIGQKTSEIDGIKTVEL